MTCTWLLIGIVSITYKQCIQTVHMHSTYVVRVQSTREGNSITFFSLMYRYEIHQATSPTPQQVRHRAIPHTVSALHQDALAQPLPLSPAAPAVSILPVATSTPAPVRHVAGPSSLGKVLDDVVMLPNTEG